MPASHHGPKWRWGAGQHAVAAQAFRGTSVSGIRLLEELTIQTQGRGLHEVTGQVHAVVERAGVREGLCTVFIRHTSASLLIQENADASARVDLEAWLDRHVPDLDMLDPDLPSGPQGQRASTGRAMDFTHTAEGPDDMPSHIRAALTATSLGIPVRDGTLLLGTWQGVYVWEHRRAGHRRRLVVHVA